MPPATARGEPHAAEYHGHRDGRDSVTGGASPTQDGPPTGAAHVRIVPGMWSPACAEAYDVPGGHWGSPADGLHPPVSHPGVAV